jgi:hypothetical protein
MARSLDGGGPFAGWFGSTGENWAYYCVGNAGDGEEPPKGVVGGVTGVPPMLLEMPAAGWLPLGPELLPTVLRSASGS